VNSTVEQDHRRIESQSAPMLGFKAFYNANRVLIRIELLVKLTKGHYQVPAGFEMDAIYGTTSLQANR
jgi:transposase-like protein